MHGPEQEFAATYLNFSDVELGTLHAQLESLTGDARTALTAEIRRRGLSDAQLARLYSSELRHEAKFDQRQKEHRKFVSSFFLRGSPKQFLYFVLFVAAVLAVVALLHR